MVNIIECAVLIGHAANGFFDDQVVVKSDQFANRTAGVQNS